MTVSFLGIYLFDKGLTSSSKFRFWVYHGFHEGYDFVGYFKHFQTFYYPGLWNHIIGIFEVNPCHGYLFFLMIWPPWRYRLLFLFFSWGILSILLEIICCIQARNRFLLSMWLGFSSLYYSLRFFFFCTNVSWSSFTGVWVTTSLLGSLEYVFVFWTFIAMLYFGWFGLLLWF